MLFIEPNSVKTLCLKHKGTGMWKTGKKHGYVYAILLYDEFTVICAVFSCQNSDMHPRVKDA